MPYPPIRCRYAEDSAGNPIDGGCRRKATCQFTHPDDPSWAQAKSNRAHRDGQGVSNSPWAAASSSNAVALGRTNSSSRNSSAWGDPSARGSSQGGSSARRDSSGSNARGSFNASNGWGNSKGSNTQGGSNAPSLWGDTANNGWGDDSLKWEPISWDDVGASTAPAEQDTAQKKRSDERRMSGSWNKPPIPEKDTSLKISSPSVGTTWDVPRKAQGQRVEESIPSKDAPSKAGSTRGGGWESGGDWKPIDLSSAADEWEQEQRQQAKEQKVPKRRPNQGPISFILPPLPPPQETTKVTKDLSGPNAAKSEATKIEVTQYKKPFNDVVHMASPVLRFGSPASTVSSEARTKKLHPNIDDPPADILASWDVQISLWSQAVEEHLSLKHASLQKDRWKELQNSSLYTHSSRVARSLLDETRKVLDTELRDCRKRYSSTLRKLTALPRLYPPAIDFETIQNDARTYNDQTKGYLEALNALVADLKTQKARDLQTVTRPTEEVQEASPRPSKRRHIDQLNDYLLKISELEMKVDTLETQATYPSYIRMVDDIDISHVGRKSHSPPEEGECSPQPVQRRGETIAGKIEEQQLSIKKMSSQVVPVKTSMDILAKSVKDLDSSKPLELTDDLDACVAAMEGLIEKNKETISKMNVELEAMSELPEPRTIPPGDIVLATRELISDIIKREVIQVADALNEDYRVLMTREHALVYMKVQNHLEPTRKLAETVQSSGWFEGFNMIEKA